MPTEIKLPELPKDPAVFDPGRFGVAYSFSQLQAYARSAVELNRVVVDEAMVERAAEAIKAIRNPACVGDAACTAFAEAALTAVLAKAKP